MAKVTKQHLPRVRNGRVVQPPPGADPGPSSSRRKSTRKVAQKKKKQTSFFIPHLDQEFQRKVTQIARKYNIYVRITKNNEKFTKLNCHFFLALGIEAS
jgi:hypothetical protein